MPHHATIFRDGLLEPLTEPGTAVRWRGWSGIAEPLVTDALWAEIAPLLPPPRPRPKGGRPPVDDRAALTGILFVLKSGIPWEMLPREMGCGCGMTCWRRLRDRQRAGVWARLRRVLLDRLGRANAIDWRRCASTGRASRPKGGRRDRPEPDRSRQAGQQAASSGRCRGHPARPRPDAGQRPRQPDARARARRRAVDPAAPRPAASPPGQAARGQGLRLWPLPRCLPQAPDHPKDRATGDRQQRAAGPPPAGRGAQPRLVRPVPPAHHPLRATCRHPPSVPHHFAAALICLKFAERRFC
jgi:transposase